MSTLLKSRLFLFALPILGIAVIFGTSFLFVPPPEEAQAVYVHQNVPNPTCFDNYESWTSSDTFKADAPWSTAFMATHPMNPNSGNTSYGDYYYFDFNTDLNGDGLPDYIYAYHNYSSSYNINYTIDCVYLSNGQGWDLAYRCIVKSDGTFYGDCAG